MIRADPVTHWELLSGPLAPGTAGAWSSLGLSQPAQRHLLLIWPNASGPIWVPEYGRQFTIEHGLDHCWTTEDFIAIARQQATMEDAAARRSAPVLVCDTDVLATSVWHERYMGTRSTVVEAMAAARQPSLYVLTADEIPFVQDGLRDGEHLRRWMTERFREVLGGTGVEWLEVEGGRNERVDHVVRAIGERLGECWLRRPEGVQGRGALNGDGIDADPWEQTGRQRRRICWTEANPATVRNWQGRSPLS